MIVADITEHQASAPDTRCKRRFRTRMIVADITEHQASARDIRCKSRIRCNNAVASIASVEIRFDQKRKKGPVTLSGNGAKL